MKRTPSLRHLLITTVLSATSAACSSNASAPNAAGDPVPSGTGGAGDPGAMGTGGGSTGGSGATPAAEGSLAAAYADYFPIGVAVGQSHLSTVGELIEAEFNHLTAENAMKWASIQPTEGNYTTSEADLIADAARANGWKMTGHTFVWHRQTPAWVGEGSVDDIKLRLRAHINAMIERYGDVVDNWDVVNEAVSEDGSEFRTGSEAWGGTDWYALFGSEDYVYWAFKYADDALEAQAPGSSEGKLYYNDFNTNLKIDKIIELLDAVNAKSAAEGGGRLVDGIGFQGHVRLDWPSIAEIGAAMDKAIAAGYAIKVSELDVTVYNDYPAPDYSFVGAPEVPFTPELDAELALRYSDLFTLFRSYGDDLTSVTLWGVSDDATWLDEDPVPGRDNYPLLFDDNKEPKAAYDAIKNF